MNRGRGSRGRPKGIARRGGRGAPRPRQGADPALEPSSIEKRHLKNEAEEAFGTDHDTSNADNAVDQSLPSQLEQRFERVRELHATQPSGCSVAELSEEHTAYNKAALHWRLPPSSLSGYKLPDLQKVLLQHLSAVRSQFIREAPLNLQSLYWTSPTAKRERWILKRGYSDTCGDETYTSLCYYFSGRRRPDYLEFPVPFWWLDFVSFESQKDFLYEYIPARCEIDHQAFCKLRDDRLRATESPEITTERFLTSFDTYPSNISATSAYDNLLKEADAQRKVIRSFTTYRLAKRFREDIERTEDPKAKALAVRILFARVIHAEWPMLQEYQEALGIDPGRPTFRHRDPIEARPHSGPNPALVTSECSTQPQPRRPPTFVPYDEDHPIPQKWYSTSSMPRSDAMSRMSSDSEPVTSTPSSSGKRNDLKRAAQTALLDDPFSTTTSNADEVHVNGSLDQMGNSHNQAERRGLLYPHQAYEFVEVSDEDPDYFGTEMSVVESSIFGADTTRSSLDWSTDNEENPALVDLDQEPDVQIKDSAQPGDTVNRLRQAFIAICPELSSAYVLQKAIESRPCCLHGDFWTCPTSWPLYAALHRMFKENDPLWALSAHGLPTCCRGHECPSRDGRPAAAEEDASSLSSWGEAPISPLL